MCFIYKSTRDDEMEKGITERETKGKGHLYSLDLLKD